MWNVNVMKWKVKKAEKERKGETESERDRERQRERDPEVLIYRQTYREIEIGWAKKALVERERAGGKQKEATGGYKSMVPHEGPGRNRAAGRRKHQRLQK